MMTANFGHVMCRSTKQKIKKHNMVILTPLTNDHNMPNMRTEELTKGENRQLKMKVIWFI